MPDAPATPRNLRIVVIGAGMSGILSGVKLREAGYDLAIYEKGDGPGGTWRENTYPGLSCDVPSHAYRYSWAPNPEWSHLFSPGAEIQAYFAGVARDNGLDAVTHYGQEVTRCDFVDGRWQIETSGGLRDEADAVIAATGVLHHPAIPELEGLESFEGACFHSARWDHAVPLDGRRVGVVGTGSTAIQITTALAERASHFALFQRTAQWVLPQENPPYAEEDKENFRRNPDVLAHIHEELLKRFIHNFSDAVVDADSPQLKAIELACRANLDENVHDPELRAKLTPDYRAACKRLIISGDFYPAIQAPNAELVTAPIERVEPEGVRTADGVLHPLDVLVLATGFRAHQFMRPMQIRGRDGVSLADAWEKRPTAYRAISVPSFPNFFMLIGPNSPVGNFSLIDVAERQLGYILQLLDRIRRGEAREIAARREATEAFHADLVEATKGTIWVTGCNSWYLDDEGVPASWPWNFATFEASMAEPILEDFEIL
jgi:cation diffusion facilitator CzcD-associated flavoprotein CzcO